jgi:hypothetical protein
VEANVALVKTAGVVRVTNLTPPGSERATLRPGWSAVCPFTAMVIFQSQRTQAKYIALFVAVVGASFLHEAGLCEFNPGS